MKCPIQRSNTRRLSSPWSSSNFACLTFQPPFLTSLEKLSSVVLSKKVFKNLQLVVVIFRKNNHLPFTVIIWWLSCSKCVYELTYVILNHVNTRHTPSTIRCLRTLGTENLTGSGRSSSGIRLQARPRKAQQERCSAFPNPSFQKRHRKSGGIWSARK